jgi:plastocyanin
MSTKSTIFTVTVVGLLATGCSSSADTSDSAAGTTSETSVSDMSSPSTPAPKPSDKPENSRSAPSADTAVITIADFMFDDPQSVAPGAEITVKNEDTTSHTVTSSDGFFDVTVEGGATATFTAPSKAGQYAYVCNLHGGMTGTVVVQ